MADTRKVVPPVEALTETEFRNTWLCTLARLCAAHGDDKVAQWLGVGERHLRNLKSGQSIPTADKIWNLLARDSSAHDELDARFGVKNVPSDSICASDPLTRDLIALANEVAQSEDPNSPGGVAVTDHELLVKDEHRMRRVHRTLGVWLGRISDMRRPRAVGGRA